MNVTYSVLPGDFHALLGYIQKLLLYVDTFRLRGRGMEMILKSIFMSLCGYQSAT